MRRASSCRRTPRSARASGFGASYTYLDAEVTEAFGAGAAFNPAFPTIPIGAYSPLVGATSVPAAGELGHAVRRLRDRSVRCGAVRVFRRQRDDSTFLSDGFFGNSLLLPNQDLDPAYQKIDLSASYRLHPRFRVYTTIDNLLNQDYAAAYGFPSLPATIRVGVSWTRGRSVGGSSRQ